MISFPIFYSAICLVLCVSTCRSFTAPHPPMHLATNSPAFATTTAIKYRYEIATLEKPLQLSVRKNNIPKPSKRTVILVEDIMSLDELKYFLEEDERPVVVKFYAKWCKKCQQVGRHFDRLAMELGDRIVDQQLIDGDVRFAAVEYNEESKTFITDALQIQGVPTLQMYVGTRKLLEGGSSIKRIRNELALIEEISHKDLLDRAQEADDGVLSTLIEEAFYDSPDFLNEEW